MNKITIFAGHYGSGKTNLSVNFALELKKSHNRVIVCDVDTVNPYFRTKDSAHIFEQNKIKLIAPEFANSNLDIPSISAQVNMAFDDVDVVSVFDVGGDDAGAIALGQFKDKIMCRSYDMWLVVNKYRFLTREPSEVLSYVRDIEAVSGVKFTGIVNNSNIGLETTKEYIINAVEYGKQVATLTGLPLVYTTVCEDLYHEVADKVVNPYKIKIYRKTIWEI